MKHLIIVLLLCPLLLNAQITRTYNSPRSGDEIVKQQVQFKDPGREGQNVIWDFGKLRTIDDEYTLNYSTPYLEDNQYIMGNDTISGKEDNLENYLIGIEHSTMYYLKNTETGLDVLGHENATTGLRYNPRLLQMAYPTNYGEVHKQEYESKGLYSCRIPFESKGEVSQGADAYGVMILPSGDTLKHVLRVKTIQTIEETIYDVNGSITSEIALDIENFKWYSKGYRYPIFETIKTIERSVSDTVAGDGFSTAFFFPPQDHYYLDTDPENLAVLDSLWNIDHQQKDPIIPEDNTNPNTTLSYNFYPNPV